MASVLGEERMKVERAFLERIRKKIWSGEGL
jgi:hypothetical protein